MRLHIRMLIYLLSTSLLIFAAGIGYISLRYKTKAMNDAKSITDSYAHSYANLIKAELDKDFGISRGMAQAMLSIEDSGAENKQELQIDIMRKVLETNKNYIAAFLQWDLADCCPDYSKHHGRRRYFAFRKIYSPDYIKKQESSEDIITLTGLVDTAEYDPSNPYYLVKQSKDEFLINPYFYTYDDIKAMPSDKRDSESAVLETTIIVPMVTNGKFRAIAGVDIPLNHFTDVIKNIAPFKESYAFLVANNGVIVAHPDNYIIGDSISNHLDNKNIKVKINESIQKGESISFNQYSEDGAMMYYSLAPIQIGNTKTPWAIGIRVPMDVIMAEANSHFYTSLLVGVVGLLILSLLIWRISFNITRPITAATKLFTRLSKGKIKKSVKIKVSGKDEISEMALSANTLLEGFKQTSDFAKKIGEGNLNADYQLLSPKDELGLSLVEMREKLKRSKEKLEKSKYELEKLSKIAENTDNAVLLINSNGKPEWINAAFEKMYGYNLKELKDSLGGNLKEISSHPEIEDVIESCIMEKKSMVYNSMINSKYGKNVYAQTTISPIVDKNGEVKRLVAIDSNITDIKKAQEEIQAQRDQLEQQRNQLEQLNATKDKFFSILAHDLKNPFSSLHSMSELLVSNYQSLDEEDKFEVSKKINNNAKHIFDLLEDLLNWSRIQQGLIEYKPEAFNLANLVNVNLNINSIAAEKKNITLTSKLETSQSAFGDSNMINTVLRNLINNAVKFTNENGSVEVSTEIEENLIKVKVKDSGIGLSEKDIQKLFRIDIKTKSIGNSKEKGTGLGLILCKEFVEKNGGQIGVDSKEGEGSCFWFTIKEVNLKS